MRGPSRGRGACPPPAEHAARLREKKASPRRLAVPFTWPQTVKRPRRVAVPEPAGPRPEQRMLTAASQCMHVGVCLFECERQRPLRVTVSPAPRAERKPSDRIRRLGSALVSFCRREGREGTGQKDARATGERWMRSTAGKRFACARPPTRGARGTGSAGALRTAWRWRWRRLLAPDVLSPLAGPAPPAESLRREPGDVDKQDYRRRSQGRARSTAPLFYWVCCYC